MFCNVFKKFCQGGGTQICHIFKHVFFGRITLKYIENKKGSRGIRRHAPPENLPTAVTILAFFVKFLGNFFAPTSECFSKYDAFCWYILDYACLGRKAYCYQKGSKLWKKNVFIKNMT